MGFSARRQAPISLIYARCLFLIFPSPSCVQIPSAVQPQGVLSYRERERESTKQRNIRRGNFFLTSRSHVLSLLHGCVSVSNERLMSSTKDMHKEHSTCCIYITTTIIVYSILYNLMRNLSVAVYNRRLPPIHEQREWQFLHPAYWNVQSQPAPTSISRVVIHVYLFVPLPKGSVCLEEPAALRRLHMA